jgi:hypothetical protein
MHHISHFRSSIGRSGGSLGIVVTLGYVGSDSSTRCCCSICGGSFFGEGVQCFPLRGGVDNLLGGGCGALWVSDGGHQVEVVGLARGDTNLHGGGKDSATCNIGSEVLASTCFGHGGWCIR